MLTAVPFSCPWAVLMHTQSDTGVSLLDTTPKDGCYGCDHVERETASKSNVAEYPQVLPAVEVRECWQNNESWSITTETGKTFQIRLTSHLHINPTCHQAVSLLLDINWHPATAPEPRRFHLIAQPVWFMFFQTLFGFDTFLFSHLTADWRSVPRETCAGWEVLAFFHNDGIG